VEGGNTLLVLTVEHEAVLELGGDLLSALELVGEAVLGEKTTSTEKTDAVGGGVVGETNGEAVAWELMSVRSGVADISLDLGRDHLADDVLVGEADDETVLWCSELVLVLGDKALASVVVGFTLTTTLVLDLEALAVGFVLHHFDETHLC